MKSKQLRALYHELNAHLENLGQVQHAIALTEERLAVVLRSLDATTTRLEVREQAEGARIDAVPLDPKLEMILLQGPKSSGNYRYPDAILEFQEMMTGTEHDLAESFLNWITKNALNYGHGNLRKRWAEWQKSGVRL